MENPIFVISLWGVPTLMGNQMGEAMATGKSSPSLLAPILYVGVFWSAYSALLVEKHSLIFLEAFICFIFAMKHGYL